MKYRVQWFARTVTIKVLSTEELPADDLDALVEYCQAQLEDTKRRGEFDAPNGFKIQSLDGETLREWVEGES